MLPPTRCRREAEHDGKCVGSNAEVVDVDALRTRALPEAASASVIQVEVDATFRWG